MYCKKCGKQIPDDSAFCLYCGEQLMDLDSKEKQKASGLSDCIPFLGKGWQICLMSYICWVFIWIILCITDTIYRDERLLYIFIFVIVIPTVALFVWHYFTNLRQKKGNESTGKKSGAISQESDNRLSSGYSVSPLTLFAKEHGKMQVKVERDNDGITSSYCIFIDSEGIVTKVNFNEMTACMGASDISLNKERLYIVQMPDKSYQLVKF